MSAEEKVRELAELKRYLEARAESLEGEAAKIRELMQLIDEKLASQSFKKAYEVATPQEGQPAATRPASVHRGEQYEEDMPLEKSELVYKGQRLGEVEVYRDHARLRPDPSLRLREELGPFEAFLINKILEPMKEKDLKRAADNLIRADQILSYNIEHDGEFIGSLLVRNYGDRKRLNEIMGAVRWTFYSMAQKVGQP